MYPEILAAGIEEICRVGVTPTMWISPENETSLRAMYSAAGIRSVDQAKPFDELVQLLAQAGVVLEQDEWEGQELLVFCFPKGVPARLKKVMELIERRAA